MTSLGRRQASSVTLGSYVQPVLLGLGLGLAAVTMDVSLGVSQTIATVLKVNSIHLPAPYSILAYLAAAVVIEAMFHLLPLGLATFIAEKLGAQSRTLMIVFIMVALLVAVLEPITQASVLASRPAVLIGVATFIYVYGLIACWQLWKIGPTASILMRIAFYFVWHVTLGPIVFR
jgi:hypothetical protein